MSLLDDGCCPFILSGRRHAMPVYLVTVLATSATTVGLIEGIAEATASITKVFSGALSDRLGKQELLAVCGYGLAAISKPIFPLALSVAWLVAARMNSLRIIFFGAGIGGARRHDVGSTAAGAARTCVLAPVYWGRGIVSPFLLA